MKYHTFTAGGLDRCNAARHNPVFVQSQLERRDSLFLPFSKLRPLLREDPTRMESGGKAIGWYPLNELRDKLGLRLASVDDEDGSDWVLLGVDSKDTPLFAVDITKHVRVCCFRPKNNCSYCSTKLRKRHWKVHFLICACRR